MPSSFYNSLRRVQVACESIRNREIDLELHWVLGHSRILGNEVANKIANSAHDIPLLSLERMAMRSDATTRAHTRPSQAGLARRMKRGP